MLCSDIEQLAGRFEFPIDRNTGDFDYDKMPPEKLREATAAVLAYWTGNKDKYDDPFVKLAPELQKVMDAIDIPAAEPPPADIRIDDNLDGL